MKIEPYGDSDGDNVDVRPDDEGDKEDDGEGDIKDHPGKRKSRMFSCQVCHQTFNKKESLKLHVSKSHEDFFLKSGNASSRCKLCAKIVAVNKLVKKLLKVNHKLIEPYYCVVCGKIYSWKSPLQSRTVKPEPPPGVNHILTMILESLILQCWQNMFNQFTTSSSGTKTCTRC
jgi:hypothetical protein